MKYKNLIKNIFLMSLVIVAAVIGLICFFTLAIKSWKELIALVICVAFLILFGKVNAW